jgi:hypothetical protein
VSIGGQDLAGRFSDALILVVLELFEHAKDALLIDPWRPIAEYVKYPASNVGVGVAGHLQESIPNLRIVKLNFARTQSLNRFEPQFGIVVSAQFEQARYF